MVRLAVLERNFMGAEKSRNDAHRQLSGESRDDAERLDLIIECKAVAGLDLHRRYAVGR